MKYKRVSVKLINPAPYNPRKALKAGGPEYEKLRRSLDEFGLVEPLIWNSRSGNLVGGHQRFTVLLDQGAKHVEVSAVDLPPVNEKALNLALNKAQGAWDEGKLAQLLDELIEDSDLDLALTGFDLDEATGLIDEQFGDLSGVAGGGEADFDFEAELDRTDPSVTQPGDLILLGGESKKQHRLLCGDSTNPMDVRRLMNGERAALFATDPPYLVNYTDPEKAITPKSRRKKGAEEDWDNAKGKVDLYEQFCGVAIKHALLPDAAWYCWHASVRQPMLDAAWRKLGVLVHCQVIWVKNMAAPGRCWFRWQHEPCLMGWRRGNRPGVFSSIHQIVSEPFPCFWSIYRDFFVFAGKMGVWAVGRPRLPPVWRGLTTAHFCIPCLT